MLQAEEVVPRNVIAAKAGQENKLHLEEQFHAMSLLQRPHRKQQLKKGVLSMDVRPKSADNSKAEQNSNGLSAGVF